MNAKTVLAAALLAIVPALSQAWDARGHILIDSIAAQKLRPEVIQKMDALLLLLGTRPYTVATAGVWLDDMRGRGNPWSRWHYIDVPCAGDAFVEPPPPHALWALDQATEVLRSKTAPPKARAEALGQVMHIVGDIHQPLHVADRHDKGGNGVPVAPLMADESGPSNLHAFWDAACEYDASEGRITRVRDFNEKPCDFAMSPLSQNPWREWARETHAIACKSGWPKEWLEGDKAAPVQLTPEFVHASHAIALAQVTKAGVRLAALLNELLGGEK